MYVHSLWWVAFASLDEVAEAISQILGVPVTGLKFSAEFNVPDPVEEVSGLDRLWRHVGTGEKAASELLPVRAFVRESPLNGVSYAGIVSINPSLNFWLRERLTGAQPSRSLFLRRDLPYTTWIQDWRLSAVHLQHADAHTDVVIQGDVNSPEVLLREAGRLDDYGRVGLSFADESGRIFTVYDEGQIWLQQINPDDIPELVDNVFPQVLEP